MSSLLKDIYSVGFYDRFAAVLLEVIPTFDKQRFIALTFTDGFENMALKARMRHNATELHELMPAH